MTLASPAFPDLHATRQALAQARTTVSRELDACLARMSAAPCARAFLVGMAESAREAIKTPGIAERPLAGLAVSIKDLFDIAGQRTQAGSMVMAGCEPATADAPAVARLRAAGATLVGRTNMTEFAFSGIGINPHHGTPAAWDGVHNRAVVARDGLGGCIPGGSSSGGAVSVAAGAAFAALGSDTGGSLRIPAAFNGIVGFKGSWGLVPTEGAVPLSSTLDTVGAMTRSVRDCVLLHEVLSGQPATADPRPVAARRYAVVRTMFQDGLDADVAAAFGRSIDQVARSGAQVVEIDLPDILDLKDLQAHGGFTAAESFAWHRPLLQAHTGPSGLAYDPRVRFRIERGAEMKAWEYIDLFATRKRWISGITERLRGFDAVISPTVPIVSPSIASVAPGAERDAEFFRVNTLVLRNTSVVNMFNGCALSMPCHRDSEMPVSLMVWHGFGQDQAVLAASLQIEQALARP